MNKKYCTLLLVFFIVFMGISRAQVPDSTQQPVSPQLKAAHQLTAMQKKLNLSEDQVMQVRLVLMDQAFSLDSLKTNASGDKKSDRQYHRAIVARADLKVKALLSDDQKKLYDQWKATQREQQMEKRKNKTSPA